MASLVYTAQDEYGNDITVRLPDWRDEFPRFSGSARAVGTKQMDAIRNITGNFMIAGGAPSDSIGLASVRAQGAFSRTAGGGYSRYPQAQYCGTIDETEEGAPGAPIYFSAADVVFTADENRPRNIAFLPCIIYV